MTLRAYYRLLKTADWFYQYSDDPRQDGPYHLGKHRMDEIKRIAATSSDHMRLFSDFREHIYGSSPMPPEPPCEVCGSVVCGMVCELYGGDV